MFCCFWYGLSGRPLLDYWDRFPTSTFTSLLLPVQLLCIVPAVDDVMSQGPVPTANLSARAYSPPSGTLNPNYLFLL